MTNKQEVAISKLVETRGNVSKAMIEAGYSPVSAKNPSNLTNSKAYKSMYAPLLKKHQVNIDKYVRNIGEAMDASKTVIIGKGNDALVDDVPDYAVRLQGNKQAERFLFKDDNTKNSPEDIKALTEAINTNVDEVELQRIVFKNTGA